MILRSFLIHVSFHIHEMELFGCGCQIWSHESLIIVVNWVSFVEHFPSLLFYKSVGSIDNKRVNDPEVLPSKIWWRKSLRIIMLVKIKFIHLLNAHTVWAVSTTGNEVSCIIFYSHNNLRGIYLTDEKLKLRDVEWRGPSLWAEGIRARSTRLHAPAGPRGGSHCLGYLLPGFLPDPLCDSDEVICSLPAFWNLLFSGPGAPITLYPCCSVTQLQHARLPHLSLSPRICSSSCPLSRWCHPTISSSVTHFSCPQSFPGSVSQLFISVGQSIGASASIFPMNIQGWFPSRLASLVWCYSLEWCNRNPLLYYLLSSLGWEEMVCITTVLAVSNRKLQTDQLRKVKKTSHLTWKRSLMETSSGLG